MGGGTTDVSVYSEGTNVFTSVIVMGGHRVTQDIAHGLRTSVAESEAIKLRHGCALVSLLESDETLEVPGVGPRPPRPFQRKFLSEIIEPRVEEILLMAHQELSNSGFLETAASGIVITGGGSRMEGICENCRRHLPDAGTARSTRRGCRRGGRVHSRSPTGGFAGVVQDPKYATGVGLVLYGAGAEPTQHEGVDATMGHDARPGRTWRFFERVREMF